MSPVNDGRSIRNLAYRVTAVFFLAFTLVDLSMPGVCAEDLFGFAEAFPAIAAHGDSQRVVSSGHGTSGTPADSAPDLPDEDCFCCCSHLVATPRFVVAQFAIDRPVTVPRAPRPVTAPPRTLFHPPRSV